MCTTNFETQHVQHQMFNTKYTAQNVHIKCTNAAQALQYNICSTKCAEQICRIKFPAEMCSTKDVAHIVHYKMGSTKCELENM